MTNINGAITHAIWGGEGGDKEGRRSENKQGRGRGEWGRVGGE